jgi:hypothetical protein
LIRKLRYGLFAKGSEFSMKQFSVVLSSIVLVMITFSNHSAAPVDTVIYELKTKQFSVLHAAGMEEAAHNIAQIAMEELLFSIDITGSSLSAPVTIFLADPNRPGLGRELTDAVRPYPLRKKTGRLILLNSYPDYRTIRRTIQSQLTDILLHDFLSIRRYPAQGRCAEWAGLPSSYRSALIDLQSGENDPVLSDNAYLIGMDKRLISLSSLISKADSHLRLQLLFNYLVKEWGAPVLGRITTQVVFGSSVTEAVISQTGLTEEEFIKGFHGFYSSADGHLLSKKGQKTDRGIIAYSPNGRFAARLNGNSVTLVSLTTSGLPKKKITSYEICDVQYEDVPPVSFSMDSRHSVVVGCVGGGSTLKVFSLEQNREVFSFPLHYRLVSSVAVNNELSRIVFVATSGRSTDLYSIDTSSREIVKIVSDLYTERSPVFTTDGDRVIYLSNYDVLSNYDRFSDSLFEFDFNTQGRRSLFQSNYSLSSSKVTSDDTIFLLEKRDTGSVLIRIAPDGSVFENRDLPPGTKNILSVDATKVELLYSNGSRDFSLSLNADRGRVLTDGYKPENDVRHRASELLEDRELTPLRSRIRLEYFDTTMFFRGSRHGGAASRFLVSDNIWGLYGAADHAYGRDITGAGGTVGVLYRGLPIETSAEVYHLSLLSLLNSTPSVLSFEDVDARRSFATGVRVSAAGNLGSFAGFSSSVYGQVQNSTGSNRGESDEALGAVFSLLVGGDTSTLFAVGKFALSGDARIVGIEEQEPQLTAFLDAEKGFPLLRLFYAEGTFNAEYLVARNGQSLLVDYFSFSDYIEKPSSAQYTISGRLALYALPVRRYHSLFFRGALGIGPFISGGLYKNNDGYMKNLYSGVSFKAGSHERAFLTLDAFRPAIYEEDVKLRLVFTSGVRF